MRVAEAAYAARPSPLGAFAFLALLGFGVRLVAALVLPEIIIYDDEIYYHRVGMEIAGHIRFGTENPFSLYGWHTITGFLYYLFFPHPLVVKLVNAALGVGAAFLVAAAVARIYEDGRITRATLYAALFLPPVVLLSATALKEQAVAFGLCLFVYGIARRDLRGALWAFAAGALMLWVRNSFLFVMGAAVLAGGAFAALLGWRLSLGLRVLLVVVLLTGGTFAIAAVQRTEFYRTSKVGAVLSGKDDRGYETLSREDMTVLRYLDRRRIFSLRNLVVPPLRALYTPNPLRGFKVPEPHVIFLEGLGRAAFWYLAMPFAVIALFRSASYPHFVLFGTAVGVFMAAAYTVLTGFAETERYRWSVFPLLFALAAAGWYTEGRALRRLVVWGWWGSAVLFTVFYLSLPS